MKKLRENKFMIIVICVIIVALVYKVAQKAIDNYIFSTNSDIISEGETIEENIDNSFNKSNDEIDANNEVNDSVGEILEEETDLVVEEVTNEDRESSITEIVTNEKEIKIYVYITGEVNSPGVVILDEGSRIVDAINAAGGTTSKADISKVNLVYVLNDGMKVNIPDKDDLKNNSNFEYITMNSGDGREDDSFVESSEEGSAKKHSSEGTAGAFKNNGIVNINTATQTELETLPGIGPSLALKIINYRKENGKFSSIDEIKNVSGIGESKYENFKSYITI